MKRVVLVALSVPLLSIGIVAQAPSPSVATTPNPSTNQALVSPSPGSAVVESKGIPSLPWVVEMFASGVMLVGVFGVLWVVIRNQARKGGMSIGPRHIQFVSVCLIVPTILILGLEKVLTSETSATLIGGLAGYLLSGLGRYEPKPPQPDNDKGKDKTPESSGGKSDPNDKTNFTVPDPRWSDIRVEP